MQRQDTWVRYRLAVIWLALLMGSLLAACEPLAPEPNSQVIVITNTPTSVLTPSASPVFPTPLPTRPQPTATPTVGVTPSPTVPPCTETEGRLIDSAFASVIVGEPVPYRLYLPPCFFLSGRRYPYVILLHGSNFTLTQWADDIGIGALMDEGLAEESPSVAPMVLVMPEGGELQELNLFDERQSFEDLILTELIPEVERNFCVWSGQRAIGGISRGGFWAFSIALRHPDWFVSVGGHSPFFADDNAPPSHNPLNLAASLRPDTALQIYLDHASGDSAEPNTIRFSNILRNRGVIHTYEISATGGHDNDYWSSQARDYLEFYSTPWPKSVTGLPTCF